MEERKGSLLHAERESRREEEKDKEKENRRRRRRRRRRGRINRRESDTEQPNASRHCPGLFALLSSLLSLPLLLSQSSVPCSFDAAATKLHSLHTL